MKLQWYALLCTTVHQWSEMTGTAVYPLPQGASVISARSKFLADKRRHWTVATDLGLPVEPDVYSMNATSFKSPHSGRGTATQRLHSQKMEWPLTPSLCTHSSMEFAHPSGRKDYGSMQSKPPSMCKLLSGCDQSSCILTWCHAVHVLEIDSFLTNTSGYRSQNRCAILAQGRLYHPHPQPYQQTERGRKKISHEQTSISSKLKTRKSWKTKGFDIESFAASTEKQSQKPQKSANIWDSLRSKHLNHLNHLNHDTFAVVAASNC